MSVQELVAKELETLKLDIINRHIQAGQRVTGKTINSLRVVEKEQGGELWGAEYIGVLEKGRKGGKVPYDFKAILVKWAQAKGITFGSQSELDSFAYHLAEKIKREGTKAFHQNVDIFSTPIKEFTERLTKELGKFEPEVAGGKADSLRIRDHE